MSTPDNAPNYPDILGAITNGARFNLDVVQFALAARPPQVAAGQTCELILLAQNASDADVDVMLQVELPERDQAKQKNTFTAASAKLRIGLRPAEVGFVSLPCNCRADNSPRARLFGGPGIWTSNTCPSSPRNGYGRRRAAARFRRKICRKKPKITCGRCAGCRFRLILAKRKNISKRRLPCCPRRSQDWPRRVRTGSVCGR